jgi:hypothetical protein
MHALQRSQRRTVHVLLSQNEAVRSTSLKIDAVTVAQFTEYIAVAELATVAALLEVRCIGTNWTTIVRDTDSVTAVLPVSVQQNLHS